MHRHLSILLLAVCGAARSATAQATKISAPPNDYLLAITQQWAAASLLGSLPRRAMATGDIELRVWGGYGLGGTRGVVVRRSRGRWQAWAVHVVNCKIDVQIPVSDTASDTTKSLFVALARKRCGSSVGDTRAGAAVYDADTLDVDELPVTGLEEVWASAVAAGARQLPPRVPRRWTMLDGFTYVVELREGDSYRASVIEDVSPPEVDADRQAKAVYAAVVQALAPARGIRRR